jgi:hypothetical protein
MLQMKRATTKPKTHLTHTPKLEKKKKLSKSKVNPQIGERNS